jgi:para-nitrobenzyl esterase
MALRKLVALIVVTPFFGSGLFGQTFKPVRTQSGLVQGTMEDGIAVYKGIPFAAPPVGDLRWRAPQALVAWNEVRDADKFAPACMQSPRVSPVLTTILGNSPGPSSEDCLYLNVWTPAKSPNDRLAVMVWIHGGAFVTGRTSATTYNGTNLAKKGVIVVSVAYRLGAFGFLAHPQLTAEQGGHSGNYGLLDQIAGLQWVKRNIAGFGGDPNRVTIFGESAGGVSVSMLAASPLAKGLFQGAISESGGNFGPERQANEGGEYSDSLVTAEKKGMAILAKLGVHSIAEARKSSAEDILKNSPSDFAWAWPIFDGYVLPGDQYRLYQQGRYNDTPVLIGTNSDEGALFVPALIPAPTAPAYPTYIQSGYGEYAYKILAAYPGASDLGALRSMRDLLRDTATAWPTWAWARLQSQTGKSKVYLYYFTYRPPYPDAPQYKDWGAAHGAELSYVFGNFTNPVMLATVADRKISEEVSSYWVNFAKTGDPNGKGLPHWPAFTHTNAQVMNLADRSKAMPVPNLERLQLLDRYYAWRRGQAVQKR